MMHQLAVLLLALAMFAGSLVPAAAEKRVALVIGNSGYQHTVALRNPSNDATDIAVRLRQLGFEVIDGIDLPKRDMELRIREFAGKLEASDVGLFFYAGHGLAVDGRNYLVPIDARLKSETDLDFEAVELSLVLKQLERNSRVSIVLLDACRDNPLAANLAQGTRSLAVARGLARVERAVGMMVAFATGPETVALDGEGRNSPFTKALLDHIGEEGVSINDLMIEVRKDVYKTTGGKQVPWENSSLTGQFYFKPAEPKPAEPKPAEPKPAAQESVESSAQIAALRKEIERLQTDQGAQLKSQQEQLEVLKQKLETENGKADEQANASAAGAAKREIAVEPGDSSNTGKSTEESTETDAKTESATGTDASDAKPEETKLAALDGKDAGAKEEDSGSESALPQGMTRQQLAHDMVTVLKELDCYRGNVSGTWGPQSQAALKRFNDVAKLELPVAEPHTESLQSLKDWTGPHCQIAKAVAPSKPKRAAPRKKPAKARKAPSSRKRVARPQRSRRKSSDSSVGDAQRELQRAFPATNWPGGH